MSEDGSFILFLFDLDVIIRCDYVYSSSNEGEIVGHYYIASGAGGY